jgi:hypothetical protein
MANSLHIKVLEALGFIVGKFFTSWCCDNKVGALITKLCL